MIIDPATVKAVVKIIEQLVTDEQTRKRVGLIILTPVIGFFLIIVGLQYILTTPFELLAQSFQGDDETYSQAFVEENGYYNVDGKGFSIGDYENVDAVDPEQFTALLTEASKYIGRDYVWGGSTPTTGFDCSGFVCWVYTQSNTYNLPRTTAQGIYNQCEGLPREEAKAGDLIFFEGTYNSDGDVSHIGIYLGDGTMLHCGNPIGITSIDTAYWTKHFYGFGRLGGV